MKQHLTIHIVAAEPALRAELARMADAFGPTETHTSLDELIARAPREGAVVAAESVLPKGTPSFLDRLGRAGLWLPLVVAGKQPRVENVVEAIKSGALDYIEVPAPVERFARAIARAREEAAAHLTARRRIAEARRIVASLSKREREVLDLLAQGHSNKEIGRQLQISHRTVEIHRARMMDKIGAAHPAAAVRLRLEARLDQELSPLGQAALWAAAGGQESRFNREGSRQRQ